MGWRGMAIGGCLGALFGRGLGAVFGAMLGNQIEKQLKGGAARARMYSDVSSDKREMIFLASAAAMLAKLAKADGRVTQSEIVAVERAFRRLGFSESARTYAVGVFRRAKDDGHTIYEYAAEFAQAVGSVEVRELFYELLWDLACADGSVTSDELDILRNIPLSLGIRRAWFDLLSRERLGGGSRRGRSAPPRDALAEAYALLDVSPDASDDAVKKAYRMKAKKYHPDALKAQGLPDEMVAKATEMMAKVNAAWTEIEKARGL